MADAMPVKIVATVEEYFFKIVSESIKKSHQLICIKEQNYHEVIEYFVKNVLKASRNITNQDALMNNTTMELSLLITK